jgi:DNA-binding transcriptional regulator LsrR (DeoR family)
MWEIGLRLHITKARVSQLLKKAEAEGIDTASASEIVSP